MGRYGIWVQRVAVCAVVALVGVLALRVGTSSSQDLAYRDPTAWLASGATGEVVRVNGASGDVLARVKVADAGDALNAATTRSGALVVNRTKASATVVDGAAETAAQPTPLRGVDASSRLLLAGPAPRLVTTTAVLAFDGDPGTAPRSVDLPEALRSPVVAADGSVYGLGVRTNGVRRAADTVSDVRLDAARAVTVSDGQAYAIAGTDNPVAQRLTGNEASGAKLCAGAAPTGDAQGAASTDSARWLVVVDGAAGKLAITDTEARACRTVAVGSAGASFGSPVVLDDTAYVPEYSSGSVWIVRLGAGDAARKVALGTNGTPFELFVRDGTIWFNDPAGPGAAVLGKDGVVRRIDKYDAKGIGSAASPGRGGSGAGTGGTGTGGDNTSRGGAGTTAATGAGAATTPGAPAGRASGSQSTGDAAGTGTRTAGKGESNPNTPPPDANTLVADFTYSSGLVAVNEKVSFVDRSTGSPTAWTWDFGDGTFAAGPKADKSWPDPGFYVVTLRVENGPNSSEASVTIEVTPLEGKVRPKANFGFSTAQTEVGQAVTFTDKSTGSPTSLSWAFGDGATATGSNVQHAWSQPGTYTVTLTASNAQGSDNASVSITVFDRVEPPVARITASATSVNAGQNVTLTSQSTGNPTSLQWSFGDGGNALGAVVTHQWSAPGTYTVGLTASNSAGSSQAQVTITVRELVLAPEARLAQSANVVEEGQVVRFTSLSINNPTSTTWDFGDGQSASGASVTHAWGRSATYTITLRVANAAGQDAATAQVLVVPKLQPPVASFTVGPAGRVLDTTSVVQFTDASTGGEANRWSWDFGDGSSPSAQRNPTHVFARAGSFTVRLTAGNEAGESSTTRVVTILVPPPRAGFSFAPATPRAGEDVTFTDGSTGGAVTSWSWTFGDGGTATDRNPVHRFAAPGTYTVTLVVKNANGESSSSRSVSVNPPPPVAAFTFTPASPRVGDAVAFTNTSTGGAAATLAWDFGDNTTGSGATASHAYAAPGTFTVRLTATNVSGSDTTTRTVTVTRRPPTAAFTVSPNPARTGQSVAFDGAGSSGDAITSYEWDFGEGATVTTSAPTTAHTYANAGTYTARLRVSNDGGTSAWVSVSVSVLAPANASFTVSPASGATTSTQVGFTSTSTGSNLTLSWDFGDGSPAGSGATASHRYRNAGTYDVTLTATNALGSSTSKVSVTVGQGAAAPDFTVAPAAPRANQAVTFTDASYGGPFTSYTWDFGDGATATGASATHTYTATGTYTVKLTVVSAASPGGVSTTKSITVA